MNTIVRRPVERRCLSERFAGSQEFFLTDELVEGPRPHALREGSGGRRGARFFGIREERIHGH